MSSSVCTASPPTLGSYNAIEFKEVERDGKKKIKKIITNGEYVTSPPPTRAHGWGAATLLTCPAHSPPTHSQHPAQSYPHDVSSGR